MKSYVTHFPGEIVNTAQKVLKILLYALLRVDSMQILYLMIQAT